MENKKCSHLIVNFTSIKSTCMPDFLERSCCSDIRPSWRGTSSFRRLYISVTCPNNLAHKILRNFTNYYFMNQNEQNAWPTTTNIRKHDFDCVVNVQILNFCQLLLGRVVAHRLGFLFVADASIVLLFHPRFRLRINLNLILKI